MRYNLLSIYILVILGVLTNHSLVISQETGAVDSDETTTTLTRITIDSNFQDRWLSHNETVELEFNREFRLDARNIAVFLKDTDV